MIFHTKCGILLVLYTIKYTMKQCVADDELLTFQNEESDEEDAIKQALFLVELLKSQDKPLLRSTIEESTCAPTTLADLNTSDRYETSSSINAENKTEATMQSIPDTQLPQYRRVFLPNWSRMPSSHLYYDHHHPHGDSHEPHANFYRPRAFFRRRIPDYYYFQNYYDFPGMMKKEQPPIPGFRRFQNNEIDISSASPDKTTRTTASPLTTTTKSMFKPTQDTRRRVEHSRSKPERTTLVATTQKSKPKLKKYRRQFKVQPKGPSTTKTTLGKTSLGTTKKITTKEKLLEAKTIQKNTTEKVTTENQISTDPLKNEIASELLKELKASKIKDTRVEDTNENTVTESKMRTTLRIHLAGSTRYNIPFPENHAFCYTNPESPLCRSP